MSPANRPLYMLDTNIISELARNPLGTVAKRAMKVASDCVCVSIITAAELRYGLAKKGSQKLTAQIDAILSGVEIVPLDVPADTRYGEIRAELEAIGQPIGPNDLLIAAHALALGAVLVTANVREFNRVKGLDVQNWLDEAPANP